jgi:glycosyltransferase involved in cell wall biosynthesis
MLSILIPARNKASNIRDCIASVARAGEIVVIDSHSTDATRTLAKQAWSTRCGLSL